MTIIRHLLVAVWALGMVPLTAHADDATHPGTPSDYAGLQARTIKSLSEQDIDDILHGKAWGLALPAELNGLPGPAHLLELKEDLGLSENQISRIESIYENMRKDAIEAGKNFIAAELALSRYFEKEDLNDIDMQRLLNDAAMARARLRYVHLSRHMMTPALLTPDQVRRYAVLRGYSDDPCDRVPEGHSEKSWRRHNRCR